MKRTTRGISLVELLLTLSASCVILTLSAGLIHRAMHAQSKTRAFADAERNASRLSNALRHDIHAAQDALTSGESLAAGTVLRLVLTEGQAVEYRHAGGNVQRVGLAGEEVQAREEFRFPAEIQVTAQQQQRLVVLSIATPPVAHAVTAADQRPLPAYATPVGLRVAAILGRDLPAQMRPAEEETSP